MKILLFGASGAGTTTLGKALAEQLGGQHLDADDYYWEKTDPPFQRKIPLTQRSALLWQDHLANDIVVISGSLVSWGEAWQGAFDLAVFLWIPPALRMQRLRARERSRYGARLDSEEQLAAQSAAFLAWASQYDDEQFEGRSIRLHREWISSLKCPTLCIEGDFSSSHQVELILKKLREEDSQ